MFGEIFAYFTYRQLQLTFLRDKSDQKIKLEKWSLGPGRPELISTMSQSISLARYRYYESFWSAKGNYLSIGAQIFRVCKSPANGLFLRVQEVVLPFKTDEIVAHTLTTDETRVACLHKKDNQCFLSIWDINPDQHTVQQRVQGSLTTLADMPVIDRLGMIFNPLDPNLLALSRGSWTQGGKTFLVKVAGGLVESDVTVVSGMSLFTILTFKMNKETWARSMAF